MNLILGHDEDLIAWLEDRIPGSQFTGAVTIGTTYQGEIGAVFAFFHCRREQGVPIDIETAAACDHPGAIRPGVLSVVMTYPFLQLGVRRMTALVRAGNTRSLRLVRAVGFQEEGRARQGNLDGTENIMFGITRDDYLNGRLAPRGNHG